MEEIESLRTGVIVKVTCEKCHRMLRTVAPLAVLGEEGLARIGWGVDKQGKAVCDECLPATPACPYCHGHSTDGSCPVCRLDALLAVPSPQSAGDLGIIERFRDLCNRGYAEGWISPAQNATLSVALLTLRQAMAVRDGGEK
jgi:hypothetical protein